MLLSFLLLKHYATPCKIGCGNRPIDVNDIHMRKSRSLNFRRYWWAWRSSQFYSAIALWTAGYQSTSSLQVSLCHEFNITLCTKIVSEKPWHAAELERGGYELLGAWAWPKYNNIAVSHRDKPLRHGLVPMQVPISRRKKNLDTIIGPGKGIWALRAIKIKDRRFSIYV